MLHSLSVSNIVLIERLTLTFEHGLTVLTGETGAGKSILLDALGLALGSRADFRLIREGEATAQVSAVFHLPTDHPVWTRLAEADIPPDDELILRRRLKNDGKSSASINDVPVSAALLREIGDALVEIQGQFEGRGLLDLATHLGHIDRAADHQDILEKLRSGWTNWLQAQRNLADFERYARLSTLVLLDIDHFKSINDYHGHATGDRVLQSVVNLFSDRIRGVDMLFRLGGEEFVILLSDVASHSAAKIAEELRITIKTLKLLPEREVTVSIGVCDVSQASSASDWLEQVDSAMYRAKQSGRDRIEVVQSSTPAFSSELADITVWR